MYNTIEKSFSYVLVQLGIPIISIDRQRSLYIVT